MQLRLYGRTYCHLCDEMAERLRVLEGTLQFGFDVVDVDTDPALVDRFGDRVPVLVDARGIEICHYFLDEAALRERLALE